MSTPTETIVRLVQTGLSAAAVPADAGPMQAYMKTDMPFYGVKKPARVPILREMRRVRLPDRAAYFEAVRALWALPHREERYAALDLAQHHRRFIDADSLPLYEQLIREGQWWDLVDPVASNLVGIALLKERARLTPVMERWIEDDDLWIRRTAILSQLRHKEQTDEALLFRFCLARADEEAFFIRKAIGWALRQYSYAAPDAVVGFLRAHQAELSGLSVREAAKVLKRTGVAI
ncbi:MAG: DNA alkylation repair protein [Alphaproteobacteria bacterium]|nr:DNA alkylation repair protein [Alphaproteobacteria bacterium]